MDKGERSETKSTRRVRKTMEKRRVMRDAYRFAFLCTGTLLFISLGIFLTPSRVIAGNYYIRAGATGANNGNDWVNAWSDLPATFVRGDTYYVAGGTYGGHAFNTADSGASLITIKKANIADNSGDAGWNTSYATTQAVFTSGFNITTDYWTLDGVTGSGSDTATYGFKIQIDATAGAVDGISTVTSGVRDINAKHFAIILPGSAYDYGQIPVKLFVTENIIISNSYLKNGSTNIGIWGCQSGCIIENNYIDNNWSSSNNHGGQIVPGRSENLIIRNNIFRNSSVYLVGGHVTGCSPAYEISGGGHYGGGAWAFTATILTDTTKNWVPNQYVGYTLSRNHNGSSAYSSWAIISNTSNTITVDNIPYDLNVGNAAAHGALDEGDIYWITMAGTISNITAGSFTDASHVWTKNVTANTYQLGITHSGGTLYYKISSINGNTINVLPAILIADGRANGDTYLIKSCMAPSDNLQFYNNVIIGNGSPSTASGVISADSAYTDVLTNLKVYNNTFYNAGIASLGWVFPGALSDTSKKAIGGNNLFYNCISPVVGYVRGAGATEVGYNAYLKSTGAMPAVGSETGMQRDDFALDPFLSALQEDFRLVSGSLAIDNGVTPGSPYNTDRIGTIRPQGSAWDIGAYEYVEGGAGVIYGDVSENGSVTAYDASMAAQYAVGSITLTSAQITKADVSGNSSVTAYDASLIAQFAVGLITRFPIEG